MIKKIINILLLTLMFLNYCLISQAADKFHDGYFWCLSYYLRLKEAINHYEKIMTNGGWTTIPYGPDLKINDTGNRVEALINILKKTSDLKGDYHNTAYIFDEEIEEAVKNFQLRHGLPDDGIVGYRTLREMNISIEDRIDQMEVNLVRIKELLKNIQETFIIINIPEFQLKIIEKGIEVDDIKVIVGKEDKQTPVFNDQITYLVFNPPWNIPPRKVIEDILPKIKEDPEYLGKNNIRVFENWQEEATEVKPENLNLDKISSGNFSYKFQQEPGYFNEMGLVKFMFPNEYLVYIHDTPHRHLFGYQKRTFSSGCIRVERPVALA